MDRPSKSQMLTRRSLLPSQRASVTIRARPVAALSSISSRAALSHSFQDLGAASVEIALAFSLTLSILEKTRRHTERRISLRVLTAMGLSLDTVSERLSIALSRLSRHRL